MSRTRVAAECAGLVLDVVAALAAGALTASAPASASQPGSSPASRYCEHLNHVPGGNPADR